jgi:lipid-A-disaccharide synthase-like uncharacterized protein
MSSTSPATSTPAASAADARAENLALRRQIEGLEARVRELQKPQGTDPTLWLVVGFVGQFVFGSRFVVQWIATERQRRSVVPVAFWYLSLAGTIILLIYSIHRVDWVFIAGFSLNMVIYLRNLYFIHQKPAPTPQ